MRFRHAPEIRAAHSGLAAGVIAVDGVTDDVDVDELVAGYERRALELLAAGPASALPAIQAWRRAFTAMGVKPTQYRCASESLLRRLGKEGRLPRIHPLVDLCNAISASTAIPVAVLDRAGIAGDLEVRPARGDEAYRNFAGEVEHPVPGEVIFADDAGQAHARRWTHKQSSASTVGPGTREVLIVTEALHPGAGDDVAELVGTLAAEIARAWSTTPRQALLTGDRPEFVTAGSELPG